MKRFGIHYFFLFALSAVYWPYFPLFLKARGFSLDQIGLLNGCMEMVGVCGPLILGSLSDRFRRPRPFLLLSILMTVLCLFPLNWISNFGLAMVLCGVIGFFNKGCGPLADALACGQMRDPANQYGRVRAVGSAGFVVTLLTIRAFHLVNEGSSDAILRAVGIMTVVVLVTMIPLKSTGSAVRQKIQGNLHGFDQGFWLWIGVIFISRLGMSAHYSFFTLYVHDVLHQEGAWLLGIAALAEMPAIFFGGSLIRRFGLPKLMGASLVAATIRLATYGLWPNLWVLIPLQLLHALTFGAFHISVVEFINRKVGMERRGLAMAIYGAIGVGLPNVIGSALGGFVITAWGFQGLFLIYSAGPVLALATLLAGRNRFNIPQPLSAATEIAPQLPERAKV